jgi:DNA-binding SARP family transcriptional activator
MFRVLGPIRIGPSYSEYAPTSAKVRSLLATLVVSADRVVPKHTLIEELWGEEPPRTATTALHVHVSRLRKELPDQVRSRLVTESPGYLLRVSGEDVDLHCFERMLAGGLRELTERRFDRAVASLRGALDLWRGPALADVDTGPLLTSALTRIDELRTVAQVRYVEAMLSAGWHQEVVGELRALVTERPMREQFCELLMLALYRSGRQVEALENYRSLRSRLNRELGIEPSRRLQHLHRAILQADRSLEVSSWSFAEGHE